MGPDDADIDDYASAASSASNVLGSEASASAAALLESLDAERAAVEELLALAARQELEANLHLAAAGAQCAALECELLAAAAADADSNADADPAVCVARERAQRLAAERQVDATNRMLAAAGRMMAQLRSEWGATVGRLDAECAQRAAFLRMSIHARGLASAAPPPRDACNEPASSATAAGAAPLAALADECGVLALFLTRALGPPPATAPAPSSAADLLRVFEEPDAAAPGPAPRRSAGNLLTLAAAVAFSAVARPVERLVFSDAAALASATLPSLPSLLWAAIGGARGG
jgi:hypothetical protein